MIPDRFDKLLDFVRRLEAAKIAYHLDSYRYDGVSVIVNVPGQRWEVDFLADGDIDVERFVSDGHIDDESALTELFANYSEPPETTSTAINQNAVITH